MSQDLLDLTEEQKEQALQMSQEGMAIAQITKFIFKNEALDGRSIEGKTIKNLLAENGAEIKTTKFQKTRSAFKLSEEQKEIILNNIDNVSKPMEMARLVLRLPPDKKIQPLSFEYQAIFKFMQSINGDTDKNEEPVEEKSYKPPIAIQHVIGKVNNYVKVPGQGKKAYDWNNLTKGDRLNLDTLVGYMNTERFVYQASQYIKKIDRILFESNFIRYTHNKPDLTEEEVDQYIALCEEIVVSVSQSRRKIRLEDEIDNVLDSEEGKRLSMVIVEAIKDAKKGIEDSKKRQADLHKSLSGTRHDRLKGKMDRNSSILNLLEAWQDEQKRNQIIQIGKREKREDEDEVERLSKMDDIVCLIAGMTKKEASR